MSHILPLLTGAAVAIIGFLALQYFGNFATKADIAMLQGQVDQLATKVELLQVRDELKDLIINNK